MSAGRVLVVEDNERNLKLVRDVLTYAGYDVQEARTGEDGLGLAAASPPDLVLMDLNLPGMDGVATMRELRAREGTSGVPVVALTALAMARDRTAALEAGFDGYLVKPISIQALREAVARYVEPRRDSDA